jgi:hypothetical protein
MKKIIVFLVVSSIIWACNEQKPSREKLSGDKIKGVVSNEESKQDKAEKVTGQTVNEDVTLPGKTKEIKPGKTDKTDKEITGPAQQKPVELKDLRLKIRLPDGFKPAGEPVKAYGRNNELLNVEMRFSDSSGNELTVKRYPQQNAKAVFDYYKQQFEKKEGNFGLKAGKTKIDGTEAWTGVSERKFDGKGHVLNPPAKVYFAFWMKGGELFELVYRDAKASATGEKTFERILSGIKFM